MGSLLDTLRNFFWDDPGERVGDLRVRTEALSSLDAAWGGREASDDLEHSDQGAHALWRFQKIAVLRWQLRNNYLSSCHLQMNWTFAQSTVILQGVEPHWGILFQQGDAILF